MSKYLRDVRLKNLSLFEKRIRKINDDLIEIINKENGELKQRLVDQDIAKKMLLISYIIRFDGKGFRLSDFNEVMKFFSDAKKTLEF